MESRKAQESVTELYLNGIKESAEHKVLTFAAYCS